MNSQSKISGLSKPNKRVEPDSLRRRFAPASLAVHVCLFQGMWPELLRTLGVSLFMGVSSISVAETPISRNAARARITTHNGPTLSVFNFLQVDITPG